MVDFTTASMLELKQLAVHALRQMPEHQLLNIALSVIVDNRIDLRGWRIECHEIESFSVFDGDSTTPCATFKRLRDAERYVDSQKVSDLQALRLRTSDRTAVGARS